MKEKISQMKGTAESTKGKINLNYFNIWIPPYINT